MLRLACIGMLTDIPKRVNIVLRGDPYGKRDSV
jgi:hypothetical protein